MKSGACIASYVGYELLRFIVKQEHKPCYVITRFEDSYEEAISGLCSENGIPCHRGMNVNSVEFVDLNKKNDIDVVFLLWWPVIIRKPSLQSVKRGFINLHPSFLPFNRGMNPYYWCLVDGTPAGVSIHWIDEQVDHGSVLFQRELDVPITETGEHLYQRAAEAMIELFALNYNRMIRLEAEAHPQSHIQGTVHRARDMFEHSRIELNRTYRAGDLINILRARTFTNGDSAYFFYQGKKYNIRVAIEDTGESAPSSNMTESSAVEAQFHADSKA
jgi:methionyl-tRNA formyltransferase